ncbi:sensor histidine kinase [Streptomyces sp. NPDC057638]|uniref:sensor histidine kinase n=1 Tax=Streptomyces sp. NPDC057638 TaxID=3346190 RepID=UPI0036866C15
MTMTDAEFERWVGFFPRWLPYGLLGFSALLAVAGAKLTPGTAERVAVVVLVVAALALQVWWGRIERVHPGPHATGTVYYVARWAIGFALTWLNEFFALYAATGYFDGHDLVAGARWRRIAPFACALPVASAQSGGLPFHSAEQGAVFAGMLLFNIGLLLIVGRFYEQQEKRSRARAAAIVELERANTALQQALDENAALHSQLLVQAREAGVADERRRLAAEIHDTIAQGLTGIIAQLTVVANTPDPAAARVHLDRATDLARHSLGEARRSVHNLAPVGLAYDGLPQALRKTVDQWSEHNGVRAEFTATGTPRQLHGEVSATLLRITEEALANAAKHAAASRVGVTLSFMDDEITVDIRDDGQGFDPLTRPGRSGSGGFGLDGMRARAERLTGSLTVESEPGGGTAVSARVPWIRHEP